MRLPRTIAAALVVLPLVAASLSLLQADEIDMRARQEREARNVLVKISVGKVEGGRERTPLRSYHILAPGNGSPVRINTANRVPIPAVTMPASSSDREMLPVSSYSYQNVGFQASVRAQVVGSDEVRVSADIEDAALHNPADLERRPGSAAAPVITSFSQTITSALIREGAPLTTTVVEDPKGQSVFIQIEVEIQQ